MQDLFQTALYAVFYATFWVTFGLFIMGKLTAAISAKGAQDSSDTAGEPRFGRCSICGQQKEPLNHLGTCTICWFEFLIYNTRKIVRMLRRGK